MNWLDLVADGDVLIADVAVVLLALLVLFEDLAVL